MALSNDLIGTALPPTTLEWDDREVMLYALGVGARPPRELTLLDESKGPDVLPTFALIANFWAVRDVRSALGTTEGTMVHAAQALEVHRPVPARGAVETQARLTALWDKGRNTVCELTSTGLDSDGLLFTARSTTMLLGVGGWGGERGTTDAAPDPGEAAPDAVFDDVIRPEQSAIYRLSGDRNPLHIDPEAARRAGFDDVFLHGLCTMGFAARAVIATMAGGEPARLRSIACRFAKPVFLDAPLRTELWHHQGAEATTLFRSQQDGTVALGSGTATVI